MTLDEAKQIGFLIGTTHAKAYLLFCTIKLIPYILICKTGNLWVVTLEMWPGARELNPAGRQAISHARVHRQCVAMIGDNAIGASPSLAMLSQLATDSYQIATTESMLGDWALAPPFRASFAYTYKRSLAPLP